MKTVLPVFAALMASGCAAVAPHYAGSADHKYRQESGRLEAVEQYERLRERCDRAGGIVYMNRQSGGRFAPETLEMRSATCGRPVGSAQVW